MEQSPEKQRLDALQSYHIINADIADELDGLVELASNICEAPISLVNLVGATRQVTKARRGLDITEIPREDSFCQHTIMGQELMIVEDAHSDARFKDNPLVTGDPHIRFYAGMPLESTGGHNLGAVCLIDREPRQLSEAQKRTLKLIAGEVSARLELIKSAHTLQEQNRALKKSDLFIQNSSDVQAVVAPDGGTIVEINDQALALYGCPRAGLVGQPYGRRIPEAAARARVQGLLTQTERGGEPMVTPVRTDAGRERYLEHSFSFHEGRWYVTARDVTDKVNARKRAQKAEHKAREEQHFSSLLIKNLPDAFWLMDKDGNVADWNKHLEEVSGFSGEQIRGRFILDFFAEDQRAELQEALSEAFTGGKASAEGALITKDGAEIPHALTGIKFTYHGEPYIAGIGVNIKELIDHKTELEKKEQQLSRAQEIAQMGSWEMNFDDMVPHWSDQMYNILGISEESIDLSVEKLLQFLPAEDRPGLQKYIDDAMAGVLDAKGFEHRIINTEGETRHVLEREELDYDDQGNAVKMSGTMQDITERKRVERELSKRSEAIESSIDGIAISNADGEYIYMNPAHASIFGYDSPEDLMGKPWALLYEEEKAEFFEKEIMPVLQEQGKWRGEAIGMRKDGSLVPHELTLTYVEGGGLICIVRDITERKEAQLQLQQSLQEKDMLLAEIHHRVKNNLAIISGLLELEAYKTDEAHTRRVLEESTMRIKSMAVVHEMLYQTDDFNTLNFKAFVPKVIEAIKGAHPPSEQEITFEVDVDDIILNVNQAIPCGLIINELVTNAYQHGFAGGGDGHITVALAETSSGISLQVSDSGDGLPTDFTPEGDSLGFTLIKTLAKQLKGDFSYTSEPLTTFSVRFPKRNGKGAASALPAGYAP